jgi:hypothetical protein
VVTLAGLTAGRCGLVVAAKHLWRGPAARGAPSREVRYEEAAAAKGAGRAERSRDRTDFEPPHEMVFPFCEPHLSGSIRRLRQYTPKAKVARSNRSGPPITRHF